MGGTSFFKNDEIGVTCCDSAGKGTRPDCKSGISYQKAKSHRECNNLKLCSAAQIKEGSGESTGCLFDHGMVWTSTSCIHTLAALHGADTNRSFERNSDLDACTDPHCLEHPDFKMERGCFPDDPPSDCGDCPKCKVQTCVDFAPAQ